MEAKTVKVTAFDQAVENTLNGYSFALQREMNEAYKELADTGKEILEAKAPRRPHGGKYAGDFDIKQQTGRGLSKVIKVGGGYVIYNKKHYQLTHLLEHGHKIFAIKEWVYENKQRVAHREIISDNGGKREHWTIAQDEILKLADEAVEAAAEKAAEKA